MSSNSGMELNKIAAAILLAGLIGMVAGKASEFLYYGTGEHHENEPDAKRGYKIEVTEDAGAGGAAAPVGPGDISALVPKADIAAGKAYFETKCTPCHNIDKGGANMIGPNLYGVMGRPIASHPGFNYSDALKKHASDKWNWDNMNDWQWKPSHFAPGTIMSYAGQPKDETRANLIAFLNSEGDSHLPNPTPKPAAKADDKAAKPADAKAAAPATK